MKKWLVHLSPPTVTCVLPLETIVLSIQQKGYVYSSHFITQSTKKRRALGSRFVKI